MAPKYFLFAIICLVVANGGYAAPSKPQQKQQIQIQTFINLLDYVGKDYHNAVEDGKIKNQSEYKEMAGFSRRIGTLFAELDSTLNQKEFSSLKRPVNKLEQLIKTKAPASKIAKAAGSIRQKVLALHLIKVTPPYWPNLKKGRQLFSAKCSSCHGKNGAGNGPLAKQLDPQPTNFQDSSVASSLSPLQAYNTIRLGIDGTAMRPFRELSDQQAWNIAFYVNSLSFSDSVTTAQKDHINQALSDTLRLETIATLPNKKWMHFFRQHNINPKRGMAVLRSLKQGAHNGKENSLDYAIRLLHQSAESYKNGNKSHAATLALKAYLKGVEPQEAQIKATDPQLVSTIESNMFAVRSAIEDGKSLAVLQQHIKKAGASIKKANDLLHDQDYSFWFTFIVSASILLREGMEAFLIIMVILSVLKSVDASRSIKFVHAGWLLALVLGIISWFFAEQLIQMSSFQREFMEGLGSVIAVGMLLYIGFWLHNKTYASQWTKFVKEKIHRLLNDNNRWGLALLAFVVVFREAFESVIFLSSIGIKSSGAGNSGIILGSISAIIVVLLLGLLMMKYAQHIPIQALFKYSAMVMAVLAVILMGKGIHSFQEAGYLSVFGLPLHFHLSLFGIYPTLQSIAAQIVIVGFVIGLWYYGKRLALKAKIK